MQPLSELLEKETSKMQKPTLQEVMDTMTDIELTEDERLEALIAAKFRKKEILRMQEVRQREAQNRAALVTTKWTHLQLRDYALFRAGGLFDGKFSIDVGNEKVFELLCRYFSDDNHFLTLAELANVKNPSPYKGILLYGGFGTGKSWMMKLFQKNQRQVYQILPAAYLSGQFSADGEAAAAIYYEKKKNAVNDSDTFYQQYSGLCVDDLGTEDVAIHYGQRKNVIADLIESRYSKGNTGVFLHATTNLTYQQMQEFYGGRVISRLHEMFNFIELTGKDRRK